MTETEIHQILTKVPVGQRERTRVEASRRHCCKYCKADGDSSLRPADLRKNI